MNTVIRITGIFAAFLSFASFASEDCWVTREYVTTLEFLRNEKSLGVQEEDAKKIAEKVSGNCTDAARKFIRVVQVLSNSGFSGRDALQKAVEISSWKMEQVDAFEDLFLASFARDGLDLSMGEALEMSFALTKDSKTSLKLVQSSFVKLVDFCVGPEGFQLPKNQCAAVVKELSLTGQKFETDLSEPFMDLVRFLVKPHPDGPGRSMAESYQIARDVLKYGPMSAKNFIQAYQYAMSTSGLKYTDIQAMEFAKNLSRSSSREMPEPSLKEKR